MGAVFSMTNTRGSGIPQYWVQSGHSAHVSGQKEEREGPPRLHTEAQKGSMMSQGRTGPRL